MDQVGHHIGGQVKVPDRRKFGRAGCFKAIIGRVLLEILEDRQAILDRAGFRFENIVGKQIAKDRRAQREYIVIIARIELAAPAFLGGEIRVPDFKRFGRDMRAVGQQFLG